MSSPRLPLSARPAFLPDEISRREFATVFRGYDPAEVRTFLNQLSEQAAETADRVAEIQKTLANTEQQVKNPELDEETVTRLLGEQTAQILRSAREAANETRSRAEDEVSRSLRDAHEVTTRMREEAETLLAERTEEAERMAETVRTEAAEAADATRRRASDDAADIRTEAAEEVDNLRREAAQDLANQREQAKNEARELIELARRESEALVSRTRQEQSELLEGIVRKRKIALAQVEELRAGRQRLLQAYKLVRSSLDDVTAELERVEAEARASAETAGVAAAEASGINAEDLDEVIEMQPIQLQDDVPSEVINLIESESEPEPQAQAEEENDFDAEPADSSDSGPALFDAEADFSEDQASGNGSAQPSSATIMERLDIAPEQQIIDVDLVDDEDEEIAASQSSGFMIGETYSRTSDSETDAEIDSQRQSTMARNRSQALRRLRRALQEEQDVVVSRLRNGNAQSIQALVGSPDDQAVSYQRAVEKLFREVARSGATALPDSSGLDQEVIDNTATNAAASLATELVEDLRSQLVPVVDELLAADEMPDSNTLQTLINASYSGVRGDYLDELVDERMAGVFDQGVALSQ